MHSFVSTHSAPTFTNPAGHGCVDVEVEVVAKVLALGDLEGAVEGIPVGEVVGQGATRVLQVAH